MKTQRFYLDTSVFGGVFDKVFQADSIILFDELSQGKFSAIYSSLTIKELVNAPQKVKKFFHQLPKEYVEMVDVPSDATHLAQAYIKEGVVGLTNFDDCIHIATATICNANLLISWNFKHIVNVFRIRGYNFVNLKMGYQSIDIRSPKDVIGYETRN